MTAVTAYRRVIALIGPLPPLVSFLGRLPTAMCRRPVVPAASWCDALAVYGIR